MTQFKTDTNDNPMFNMDHMSLSSLSSLSPLSPLSSLSSLSSNPPDAEQFDSAPKCLLLQNASSSMNEFENVAYDAYKIYDSKLHLEFQPSTSSSAESPCDLISNRPTPRSQYAVDDGQYVSLNMVQWNNNKLPITARSRMSLNINDKSENVINIENKENLCIPSVLEISKSKSNPAVEFGNTAVALVYGGHFSDITATPNPETMQTTQTSLIIIDDTTSHNLWLLCCEFYDNSICCFDTLFPRLLKVWRQQTKCKRLPSEAEIKPIFLRFGGEIVDNICIIKQKAFIKFWKWFKNCCGVINEIKHLWDSFRLNLFWDRTYTEEVLNKCFPGTFALRISATLSSTIIISYVNATIITVDGKTATIKHVQLKRESAYKFAVHKSSRRNKATSLTHLIRSFVKLKYIWISGNKIYPKNVVF